MRRELHPFDPVAVTEAWMQAFDRRDLDAMLALTSPDLEYTRWTGVERGHDAVRALLERQSFGVAMRSIRTLRTFSRGATVVVETQIESHFVDTGEPAGGQIGAAFFVVDEGLVTRFAPRPDLAGALADAGLAFADLAMVPA